MTVLLTLGAAHSQPGPGGQRGGFRADGPAANRGTRMLRMLYLERAWLAASFDLEATDEQLLQLRPMFQAAWETRRKAIEETVGGDLAGRALALSEATDQVATDVDNALAGVLDEDQLTPWEEMKADPMGGFGMGLGLGIMRPGGAVGPPQP